jgi:hypothetical protein
VEQEVGGSSPPNCTTYATDKINIAITDANGLLSHDWLRLHLVCFLRFLRASHTVRQAKHFGGFAMIARSRKFQLGSMLATILSVSMWSAAGYAYTQEQQQACSGDAFRLCSADIPDVDRITVCMIRNRSQLSPGCRAYFRQDPEASIKPESSRRQASDRPRRSRRDDD